MMNKTLAIVRNWGLPAGLFAAVTTVSELTQHYSFIMKENLGIFLTTPDWLKETRNYGHFLRDFVESWTGQWFDIPLFGALFTAVCVTGVFLLLRTAIKRIGLPFADVISVVPACVLWYFMARSGCQACLGLGVIAAATVLSLASLPFRKKDGAGFHWAEIALAGIAVCTVAILNCTSAEIRGKENWDKLEICIRTHEWDKVLEVATPEETAKDRNMVPFALLALNAKGELASSMFRYPVERVEDLDGEGELSRRGYYFTAILYECLNCPNEALHNMFQVACFMPHGSCSMVLKQLVKLNLENENYTLARKYLAVLEKSPRNRALARKALRMYANAEDRRCGSPESSASAPSITNGPLYNLALLQATGNKSQFLTYRALCYQLLLKDLQSFTRMYQIVHNPGDTVPRHFQEAMLLAGANPDSPEFSAETRRKFSEYTKAKASGNVRKALAASRGTYWEYWETR